MKILIHTLIVASLLTSCGYHYKEEAFSDRSWVITVPYIPGDVDAILNSELVYGLGSSGYFRCVQAGADYVLQAKILSDTQSRIGFRYDRDNVKGTLEKNLLGVEDRRSVLIEVSLIDSISDKVIAGPFEVSADAEYDYIDPGSPKDLIFKDSSGSESVIQFSLGQLDSYEGAYDDSARSVFRKLSEKIVEGLINHLSEIER